MTQATSTPAQLPDVVWGPSLSPKTMQALAPLWQLSGEDQAPANPADIFLEKLTACGVNFNPQMMGLVDMWREKLKAPVDGADRDPGASQD